MLHFPFLPVPLIGPAPPSLPTGAKVRWRPFLPVRLIGSSGHGRHFRRALLDPGSDDTIFPLATAKAIGIVLQPDTGHAIRWSGQSYSLRFGDAQLELADDSSTWRWPAILGFSDAPIPYCLLGNTGCLEYFNVTYRGDDRIIELDTNASYHGIKS